VSSARRVVTVDSHFFDELDAILGPTRGPNGEPSTTDFLLSDLPSIADAFAERFDDLYPVYPDRDDYRFLVAAGRLVKAAVVIGQLVSDGSIVLFEIEIDPY
jgi:hypothetical protein